jgi:plasmid stabilization system protein ParE
MPKLPGKVWDDLCAARLKRLQYIVYFIVLADRVEVLAVLQSARAPRRGNPGDKTPRAWRASD